MQKGIIFLRKFTRYSTLGSNVLIVTDLMLQQCSKWINVTLKRAFYALGLTPSMRRRLISSRIWGTSSSVSTTKCAPPLDRASRAQIIAAFMSFSAGIFTSCNVKPISLPVHAPLHRGKVKDELRCEELSNKNCVNPLVRLCDDPCAAAIPEPKPL